MSTTVQQEGDKKPLTLLELKSRIDQYLEMKPDREMTVCIPNNKGGMGGTSVTYVTYAGGGIDWDAGKFFICPAVKMIERPPDFTESDYQNALKRIKSLEGIVERLVNGVETKNEKELGHAIKFAKTALDIFKKKPV